MKKLIMLLVFATFVAKAQEVKVVDGDSLIVNGKMTRLIGIDAPEFSQECYNAQNEPYNCGNEAMEYMKKMLETGKAKGLKVKCKKHDTDKYGRNLSTCKLGDVNLNKLMVAEGHAIAYRHNWYEEDEKSAKRAKKGIWQGRFMRPELLRILKKYEK